MHFKDIFGYVGEGETGRAKVLRGFPFRCTSDTGMPSPQMGGKPTRAENLRLVAEGSRKSSEPDGFPS
jgi:hypothetical protein